MIKDFMKNEKSVQKNQYNNDIKYSDKNKRKLKHYYNAGKNFVLRAH
jgi:hypothetical protein